MRSRCFTRVGFFCRSAAAGALLTFVAAGCGKYGDVSGKVTYQGKPLVFGTVQFEASDKSLKQGTIKNDGSFFIPAVRVGEANVAVSSPNPKSSDFMPLQREGQPPPPPRPDVPGWFPIPPKYDAPYTSGLTYTIKAGQNTIDIALEATEQSPK